MSLVIIFIIVVIIFLVLLYSVIFSLPEPNGLDDIEAGLPQMIQRLEEASISPTQLEQITILLQQASFLREMAYRRGEKSCRLIVEKFDLNCEKVPDSTTASGLLALKDYALSNREPTELYTAYLTNLKTMIKAIKSGDHITSVLSYDKTSQIIIL